MLHAVYPLIHLLDLCPRSFKSFCSSLTVYERLEKTLFDSFAPAMTAEFTAQPIL